MARNAATGLRSRGFFLGLLVLMLLAGLPIAVWLDLSNLSDAALHRQAADLNSVITSMRGYYASNVVGRVLASPGSTQVVHNYETIPGAIPIPATLSLELGRVLSEQQHNITYRFVSDYPFKNRAPHVLDEFERNALALLRADPNRQVIDASRSIFTDRVRLVTPVIMGATCVNCHNAHLESPKRDWKVGDVRGIQEVAISQPIAANLFSFKYLLIYFALIGTAGFSFLVLQRRHAMVIQGMNRQLEEASKHKSQFLANMSHELRTPLNAVLGYTELILDNVYGEISEKMRDVLQRIESNGRHLLGLINDVLDLSKIEAGQLTLSLSDYSLKNVIQTVFSAVEPLASEKRIGLRIDVAPELPQGRGDERRLTQVLLNLVGNAIKFTDAGEVSIIGSLANGSFHVAVRDSGPGISTADQAKLFQEFQQGDNSITRKKGGTGLGLAISKRIIELHGGRIWVESSPGQGSTFAFTLPVTVEEQGAVGLKNGGNRAS
jgi:signal transduction histidine kinase